MVMNLISVKKFREETESSLFSICFLVFVCFVIVFQLIFLLSSCLHAFKGILTKWTPSVQNWCQIRGGEAESEAENEERNVKTLPAMDWRTQDNQQHCFILRCECKARTVMTMLHAEFLRDN